MTFAIGTRVVYPVHGIADVVAHEKRTIDAKTSAYLVLSIAGASGTDDMTISVPVDRLGELGVRHAISPEDANDVLAVLSVRNPRVASNWSRRFKNHQEKLRTGDVFACAEVVRNLAVRQRAKPLAPAETAMYRQARHSLVSELAVTWDVSHDDAADRVDRSLQPIRAS